MRIRDGLFVVLIACGSGEKREQAPSPPVTSVAAKPAPITTADVGVALPQIAVPDLPLDQIGAPFSLTASDGSGLVATRVDAKAVVQGPLAFTELHLYFANPEDRIREGTFAITLPANAAVSRFAMQDDGGRWMEAEVVEKQLARRAYEDFLHRRQDPALMEKAPGNQFTARVFPIAPKSVKHLVVSFSQELPGERYVLPLRGLPKVKQLDVSLLVTSPVGAVAHESLSERDWQPDRDFVSKAPSAAEAIAAGSVVVAQVSPFDQAIVAKDVPTDLTLLVDTSASRALGFARYARSVGELVSALATRYPGLAIEVVAFDQDTQSIYAGAAAGFGAAHVEALLARGAAGASDLGQAIEQVQPRSRLAILTDGVITAGAGGAELRAKVKALADKQVARVDVVLAGGIRDRELASTLATAGLPRAGAVLDLDQRVDEVAAGLGERVLSDLSVEVAGASWVYPRTIASARPHQRAMIYARFDTPVQAIDVKIGPSQRTIAPVGGTPALVERAAAAAEIADLEAKLALANGDERKSLRAAIVEKAVAARVISSQTSMLVLESEGDYQRYGIDRKALADILVVGPNGIEQKNRTYVAVRHRPKKPAETKTQGFALEDTTDPASLAKGRIASGAAGTGHGAAEGMAGKISVADEVVAEKRKAEPEEDRHVGDLNKELEVPRVPPAREVAVEERPANTTGLDGNAQPGPAPFPPRDAPPPLKGKLAEIDRAIRKRQLDDALAKAKAWHDQSPGDVLALIGMGEALEARKELARAARMYGSIIDLFPGRADLRRFAGERLERIGDSARALAVDTYRRAVEERPDHMTGHRLLAYALLRSGKHADAFAAIAKGLQQKYPEGRFEGGKRVLVEDAGLIGAAWAAVEPGQKPEIVKALRALGATFPTRPSTRFIMYWETDANDVDFHIQDAQGGHAYYSSPTLPSGGELYADITDGYGPECFAIEGRATAGPYKLSINYYSQGPMGYGMGLLQIVRHDGKGKLELQDRPYVIMNDHAYVNLGSFR